VQSSGGVPVNKPGASWREVRTMAAETPDSAAGEPSVLKRFIWPNWEQRRRILLREAWTIVLAAYPLLAFSYLWPQDWRNQSPGYVAVSWAAFMVRVVQFHAGLLLLVVVTLALLRKHRRLAMVAVPPVLFTLGPALLLFVPHAPEPSVGPRFRVMTANLLMVNTDTDGIIAEVIAAKPDVLMLQEYTEHWHAAMQEALAKDYPYSSVVMRDDSFGIAIYSRKPFAGEVDQRFPLGRAGVDEMRAEIDIAGKRLALYNVHLLPPRTLLYSGEHRLQVADLVDTLRNEKLPYVVCGDFNFPDLSPQQSALKRAGAREAHQLAGYGRGATWPVIYAFRYLMPGIRIDHVYLGRQLTATTCETGEGRGSDHRPVVVDVAFRK
jgi:endonuclease/exonuclease/phosphatase (EEP) superfamily protein YafD